MKTRFFLILLFSVLCVSCSWTTQQVSSSTDTMSYLSEKNLVYWDLNNTSIYNTNKDNIAYYLNNTTWFINWDQVSRIKFIEESLTLYKNKQGE